MYTPKAVNAISQEAVPDTRLDSPCPVDIEWTRGFVRPNLEIMDLTTVSYLKKWIKCLNP